MALGIYYERCKPVIHNSGSGAVRQKRHAFKLIDGMVLEIIPVGDIIAKSHYKYDISYPLQP